MPSLEKLADDPSTQLGTEPSQAEEPSGRRSAWPPSAHVVEGPSGGTTQALPTSSSQVASPEPDSGSGVAGHDGGEPALERAGLDPSLQLGSLPSAHVSAPWAVGSAWDPSSQLAGIVFAAPVLPVRGLAGAFETPCFPCAALECRRWGLGAWTLRVQACDPRLSRAP